MIKEPVHLELQNLEKLGFTQIKLDLPLEIGELVLQEDYLALDKSLGELINEGGLIYNSLLPLGEINKTEYLIAIRDGANDEDGIWHDDGSRDFAFTLSLVSDLKQLEGGNLLFREKANPKNIQSIPTAPYGTLTIIKTGKDGYEHRVEKVTKGNRIICAGWIN